MLLDSPVQGCQEHGSDCELLQQNQPGIIKHTTPYAEMHTLRNHNCAIVRLFARIGLLRRAMNPVAYHIPSDHPCLDPQFYQDFKSMVVNNLEFYLKASPRILISILGTIADHDPTDSHIATASLLFNRIEEIKNTCMLDPSAVEWQANPEEYNKISKSSIWQAIGTGHNNNNTMINMFKRLARILRQAPLVSDITLALYDKMFDLESGFPYSPLVAKPKERKYPNWVEMTAEQSGKEKLLKKLHKILKLHK